MEVYCSVQQIKDEATQIKLASLRLAGTTMIWWQSKFQHGTQKVGNVFPSRKDFVFALRKQFYPLGYKEKDLIEWRSLKLRKGQMVQEYTDEFRKMALMFEEIEHKNIRTRRLAEKASSHNSQLCIHLNHTNI